MINEGDTKSGSHESTHLASRVCEDATSRLKRVIELLRPILGGSSLTYGEYQEIEQNCSITSELLAVANFIRATIQEFDREDLVIVDCDTIVLSDSAKEKFLKNRDKRLVAYRARILQVVASKYNLHVSITDTEVISKLDLIIEEVNRDRINGHIDQSYQAINEIPERYCYEDEAMRFVTLLVTDPDMVTHWNTLG